GVFTGTACPGRRSFGGETATHIQSKRGACMGARHLFTSESVTEGHPDKIADQISDSVLDELIAQDPMSRVACEVLVTTGLGIVAGEVSSKGYGEIPDPVARVDGEVRYDGGGDGLVRRH